MLKGIPSEISPKLLKLLAEMGHGDEVVIADANFPGHGLCKNVVRADGIGGVKLLDAILRILPLDDYAPPYYLMEKVPDDPVETPIWDEYRYLVQKYKTVEPLFIERFAFYEKAKSAYAIIITGETALYANIILKKGVLTESV